MNIIYDNFDKFYAKFEVVSVVFFSLNKLKLL